VWAIGSVETGPERAAAVQNRKRAALNLNNLKISQNMFIEHPDFCLTGRGCSWLVQRLAQAPPPPVTHGAVTHLEPGCSGREPFIR
jgi:hypothetical protein